MFRFIIQYFDEIECLITTCKGIIKAVDYENAIKEITNYVGKENLVSIEKLYELDDVLEDDEIVKDVIK